MQKGSGKCDDLVDKCKKSAAQSRLAECASSFSQAGSVEHKCSNVMAGLESTLESVGRLDGVRRNKALSEMAAACQKLDKSVGAGLKPVEACAAMEAAIIQAVPNIAKKLAK